MSASGESYLPITYHLLTGVWQRLAALQLRQMPSLISSVAGYITVPDEISNNFCEWCIFLLNTCFYVIKRNILCYKQTLQISSCFLAVAETDQILLEKQKANRFLSSHHRTRRSYNAVEECCIEGCVWEELYEYCKPTKY